LSFSTTVVKSQTPSLNIHLIEPQDNNNYEINTIIPLPDSTYGIFGSHSESSYMLFIKMDSLGNVIFNKKYTFSGDVGCRFGGVIINKKGEIAIVGNDVTTYNSNLMFLKLKLNGDVISSKFYSAYSTDSNEEGYSLRQTPDNGYILAGTTGNDVVLFKIDSSGTRQWSKKLGFTFSNPEPQSMEIIGNSVYLGGPVSGQAVTYYKVDINGNLIWVKTVDKAQVGQNGGKIIKTADNKLLVGGTGNFMMKIDTNGVLQWSRYYTLTTQKYGTERIITTPDGGFISCATQQSSTSDFLSEGRIAKFNSVGDVQWVRRIGTVKDDELNMIINAHGNRGYFVLGRCTNMNPSNAANIFLARLGNDGYLPTTTCEFNSEIEISSPAGSGATVQNISLSPTVLGITTTAQGTLIVSDYYKMTQLSPCNNDIEVTEIVSPKDIYCSTATNVPVQIRITNKGILPIHLLASENPFGDVIYGNNFLTMSKFTDLNILPKRDTTLTIGTINSISAGNRDITVKLSPYINEFYDINTNNNKLSKTIRSNVFEAVINSSQPTVCPNDSVVLTLNPVSIAKSYQWFRNNDTLKGATNTSVIVKDNATYFAVVRNVDNCSVQSNSIQPVLGTRPATPIITRSGSLLTATNTAATSFQWYFNGNLITNANQSTYTATQNGNYTVVAIGTNCNSLTSAVLSFVVSGINDIDSQQLTVQPNPFSHTLHITSTNTLKMINIYDISGKLVYQKKVENNIKTLTIDNVNLTNGSYLLKAIDNENNVYLRKVLVLQ
jgi:Secretion system C-terminal sorting domain